MNSALTRAISLIVLTGILIFPYFNCGAPTDKSGIFGSNDNGECSSSPTALQACLSKVRFGAVPSVVQVPGGSGKVTVNGQCVSGGFPKVLISAKIVFVGNGATINQSIDMFRCDNGIFYANVDMPASTTWTDYSTAMVLTILVFENEDSTVNTPLIPPVVANIPLKK